METTGGAAFFVSASVGKHRHTLSSIECLLDTGAQPNLNIKPRFQEYLTVHRKPTRNAHLRFTAKDLIDMFAKIDLDVRIENYLSKKTFFL